MHAQGVGGWVGGGCFATCAKRTETANIFLQSNLQKTYELTRGRQTTTTARIGVI